MRRVKQLPTTTTTDRRQTVAEICAEEEKLDKFRFGHQVNPVYVTKYGSDNPNSEWFFTLNVKNDATPIERLQTIRTCLYGTSMTEVDLDGTEGKKDFLYIAWAAEVGERTGNPHLHGIIVLRNRKRWSQITKAIKRLDNGQPDPDATWSGGLTYLKGANFENRAAIPFAHSVGYFQWLNHKEWLNGAKAVPNVTFEEYGIRPKDDALLARTRGGVRGAAATKELYAEATKAATKGDYGAIPADLNIKHYTTWRNIASSAPISKEDATRSELCNIWISGPTGLGKTSWVKKFCEDKGMLLYIKGADKWYDGITRDHQAVLFDDLDETSAKDTGFLQSLKLVADHGSCRVQYKGGSIEIRPKYIFVNSNATMSEIFYNFGEKHYDAIKRRFKQMELYRTPSGHTAIRELDLIMGMQVAAPTQPVWASDAFKTPFKSDIKRARMTEEPSSSTPFSTAPTLKLARSFEEYLSSADREVIDLSDPNAVYPHDIDGYMSECVTPEQVSRPSNPVARNLALRDFKNVWESPPATQQEWSSDSTVSSAELTYLKGVLKQQTSFMPSGSPPVVIKRRITPIRLDDDEDDEQGGAVFGRGYQTQKYDDDQYSESGPETVGERRMRLELEHEFGEQEEFLPPAPRAIGLRPRRQAPKED